MPPGSDLTQKLTELLRTIPSALGRVLDFFLFPKGPGKPPPGAGGSAGTQAGGRPPPGSLE